MLGEAEVARIAVGVATAILRNPSVQKAALRKIGRDPLDLAIKKALRAAYASLDSEFPQWTAALFDESFLEREGAACLADVVTRGRDTSPADLARRYVRSLDRNDNPVLVRDVEPAAAHLLDAFTRAIRAEPAVAQVLDSKALDSAAENIAAIRAALGAGRATEGTLWDYLRWTINRNLYLDHRGVFQTQRQVQLKLDRIYVSLDANRVDDINDRSKDPMASDLVERALEDPGQGMRPPARLRFGGARPDGAVVSLHEAVAAHSRLVVLGDPGSGKTTLLRHLALDNAERIWAEGLKSIGDDARVPVLVRVGEYADSGAWRRVSLTDFVAEYHRLADCPADGLADLLVRELDAGHCLVLLDGLDEVSRTDDRIGIARRIEDFVGRHARAGNAFVVTSREAGYRTAALGSDFVHFRAREMTREQSEQFLNHWCRAVEDAETPELPERDRQAVADREIAGILRAIDNNPGVARLAVNPLMLCVLALIHRTGAQLPQKRIELYKTAAETLAHTWRLAQGVPESALARPEYVTRLLGVLAYWMHVSRPSGIVTEAEVLAVLGPEWARITGVPWDPDDIPLGIESEVRAFLERVRIQTGLFVERTPGRYGFLHLTFEEYFAARALIAKPRIRATRIREHLHDPRWTEPILLALGFVGLDSPEEAEELVEAAVLARGEAADGLTTSPLEVLLGQDFLFALRCLADEIPVTAPVTRDLINQAVNEMFSRTDRGTYATYRHALAQLLSSLLDTTHGPALVTAILRSPDNGSTDGLQRWLATISDVPGLARQPEVLARLLDLATDPDLGIRVRAAIALSRATDQPGVLSRLFELTTDTQPNVRAQAARALGHAAHQSGVPKRLLELIADPERDVQRSAVIGLGQVDYRPDVLPRLLELTTDPRPDIRAWVAFVLGWAIEQPGVLPRLLELTTDPEPTVRWQVALTLDVVDDQPDVVIGLLRLSTDPEPPVREQAATTLGDAADRPEVLSQLLELTTNPKPGVQGAAAIALERVAARPEVLPRVLELTTNADPYVQALATGALGYAADQPGVLPRLLELVTDTRSNVRAQAAGALGYAADQPGVLPRLLELVTDPDSDVRAQAAGALGDAADQAEARPRLEELVEGVGPDRIAEDLHEVIQSDALSGFRASALSALAFLCRWSPHVLDRLIDVLRDDHSYVRDAAVRNLVKVGQSSDEQRAVVREALLGMLAVPDGGDEAEDRTAADSAYEALWALEVAASGYRQGEVV